MSCEFIAEIGNSAAPQQRHSLASINVLQRPIYPFYQSQLSDFENYLQPLLLN